jgi:hypothetical protein
MPNTISLSANNRITWTVSDGVAAESQEVRTARSITNGSGANQANVAWRNQVTIPAGQVYSFDMNNLADSALGYSGRVTITSIRDVMVVNMTTTAGAYVLWGVIGPSDSSAYAARIGRGGEYRVADWYDGQAVTVGVDNVIYVANPSSVAVTLDVAFAGVGTYSDT